MMSRLGRVANRLEAVVVTDSSVYGTFLTLYDKIKRK